MPLSCAIELEPEAAGVNPALELLCSINKLFPQRFSVLIQQLNLRGEADLYRRIRELRMLGFGIRTFRVGLTEFLLLDEWHAEEADRVASAYWRRTYGAD